MNGEPVTVTVARRVAPGREVDFEEWAGAILGEAASWKGFLGGGVLRPPRAGGDWHIVYRFADRDSLRGWEASAARGRWLRSAGDFVRETGVHRISGLETWFELPGRTAPAPPRWKMGLVSLGAVFPMAFLFNLLVTPRLADLPLAARVLALSVTVSGLMTWVVMPRVTRLLGSWLYPPQRPGARGSAA
jgi:uncharacterized protein